MTKRPDPNKKRKKTSNDLWISPHLALRGMNHNARPAEPTHARFLELADIALGLRDPEPVTKSSGNVQKNTEPQSPRVLRQAEHTRPVLVIDNASRKFSCPVCKERFSRNASDAIELFRIHRCSQNTAA